ncbi:hypothetical protein EDEG_03425 [Edhazardia aedis USNM 41457]|uniref:Cullin family profile domain-containing protein n=1 Tax=Edhazardia aedis (strain USNM 41457) TaxID=1003232 RepID=J9D3L5_EDHAE|nr:hypothetical protein EDEG_03425 [Edhazardia aedis USNM 41457]|eukprot:EJW02129.1 hypothetical protein EDEG_03425 [Edhazardia aedis USNM 41457]
MFCLLVLTLLVRGSLVKEEISGYNGMSKIKYIYATALDRNTCFKLRKAYFVINFIESYINQSISEYTAPDNLHKHNSFKKKLLKDHFSAIIKIAILEYFRTDFVKLNKHLKLEISKFLDVFCEKNIKIISDYLDAEFKNHFENKTKSEISIKEMLQILSHNDRAVNMTFIVCICNFVEELANYLKLDMFNFLNYYDLSGENPKNIVINKLVPWDFVVDYDGLDIKTFFESISKEVKNTPKDSKTIICFRIDPAIITSNILLCLIDSMIIKKKIDQTEWCESHMYNFIEKYVYESVDNTLAQYLYGLRHLYKKIVESNENQEIVFLDLSHRYLPTIFAEFYIHQIREKAIDTRNISDKYIERQLFSICKYFENTWKRIFNSVIYNSAEPGLAFIQKNDIEKMAKVFEKTFSGNGKMLKPSKRMHKGWIEYITKMKDVFYKQVELIVKLNKIVSHITQVLLQKDLRLEKNSIYILLQESIDMITKTGLKLEMKCFRLINNLTTNLQIDNDEMNSANSDFFLFNEKIEKNHYNLNKFLYLINQLMTTKIFKVTMKKRSVFESDQKQYAQNDFFYTFDTSISDLTKIIEDENKTELQTFVINQVVLKNLLTCFNNDFLYQNKFCMLERPKTIATTVNRADLFQKHTDFVLHLEQNNGKINSERFTSFIIDTNNEKIDKCARSIYNKSPSMCSKPSRINPHRSNESDLLAENVKIGLKNIFSIVIETKSPGNINTQDLLIEKIIKKILSGRTENSRNCIEIHSKLVDHSIHENYEKQVPNSNDDTKMSCSVSFPKNFCEFRTIGQDQNADYTVNIDSQSFCNIAAFYKDKKLLEIQDNTRKLKDDQKTTETLIFRENLTEIERPELPKKRTL